MLIKSNLQLMKVIIATKHIVFNMKKKFPNLQFFSVSTCGDANESYQQFGSRQLLLMLE